MSCQIEDDAVKKIGVQLWHRLTIHLNGCVHSPMSEGGCWKDRTHPRIPRSEKRFELLDYSDSIVKRHAHLFTIECHAHE